MTVGVGHVLKHKKVSLARFISCYVEQFNDVRTALQYLEDFYFSRYFEVSHWSQDFNADFLVVLGVDP